MDVTSESDELRNTHSRGGICEDDRELKEQSSLKLADISLHVSGLIRNSCINAQVSYRLIIFRGIIKYINVGKLLSAEVLGTVTSTAKSSRMLKTCLGLMTGTLVSCGSVIYILDRSVKATGTEAKPPSYPWAMEGILSSLDHESIRRGWHVYRSVCSTCHSLRYLYFKDLIDVAYTETEMKAIAAEYDVDDGPDEEGNYFKRPGKPYDRLPLPFPNEEAARAANNGALPVDLTFVVNARRKGKDYVFSVLTGYCEAPAGVALADGQLFNPYFPGGAISMPEMIQDGIVDYEDGTPASRPQIAKDVVEFLTWTANQEWDARKIMFAKGVGIGVILCGIVGHITRQKWATVRSQQILYVPKRK